MKKLGSGIVLFVVMLAVGCDFGASRIDVTGATSEANSALVAEYENLKVEMAQMETEYQRMARQCDGSASIEGPWEPVPDPDHPITMAAQ